MKTDLLKQAATVLKCGGIVAHACEGVWGLACDPWRKDSVDRVLAIKKRDAAKGLILISHVPSAFGLELKALPPDRRQAVLESWPGKHTWILNSSRFPEWVTGSGTTIAVRVPGAAQAQDLARMFGAVLVSTSANRTERSAALTEQEVHEQLSSDVDYVLPGCIDDADGPSQITVALTGERLR